MRRKPVVGVIGNATRIENRFPVQVVGERNMRAVAQVAGALPLMFASCPEITDIGALLDAVDGIVLTGARANVHPNRFNTEPHEKHEPYDILRDEVALELSEACVARGVPLFGICRGLQEMNVAFGGSLHPEIRELPGRINHRMPRLENGEIHPDPTVIFADRHEVTLVPGGAFATILGCETIKVNSLHGQGILELGQARRGRGRGGGRHHRGDPYRGCPRLCARGAVARRIRSAPQSDQPRAVRSVRRGADRAAECVIGPSHHQMEVVFRLRMSRAALRSDAYRLAIAGRRRPRCVEWTTRVHVLRTQTVSSAVLQVTRKLAKSRSLPDGFRKGMRRLKRQCALRRARADHLRSATAARPDDSSERHQNPLRCCDAGPRRSGKRDRAPADSAHDEPSRERARLDQRAVSRAFYKLAHTGLSDTDGIAARDLPSRATAPNRSAQK